MCLKSFSLKRGNRTAITTQYEQLDRPISRYLHLVGFALAYGFIALFSPAVILGHNGPTALVTLIATMIATGVLTGMWSVLGPGNYFQRIIWSHCLALIVVIGFVLGAFILSVSPRGLRTNEFLYAVALFPIGIAPISMAVQLPFWFVRVFFGWQLVFKKSPPRESITLRDFFVVTFLFALSFAAPQLASNLENPYYDSIDPTTDWREVEQVDGSMSFEWVLLTDPAEIAARKREYQRLNRYSMMIALAVAARYAFVVSLLSVPVILLMFRSRNSQVGCGWVLMYAGAWFFLVLFVISVISGGRGASAELATYWFFWLAGYGVALVLPLQVSRKIGFRLTSPARYKREEI